MTPRTGGAAALAALGAAEGLSLALRGPSPLDAGGNWVIDRGPVPLVELTVLALRTSDKPVIRAVAAGAVVAGGALLGAGPRGGRLAGVAGLAAAGALLSVRRRATAVAPAPPPGLRAGLPAVASAAAALAVLAGPPRAAGPAAAAGGVALAGAVRLRSRRQRRSDDASPPLPPLARPLPPPTDGAETWEAPTPLLTPVEDFYVTDVNMRPPLVDPASWRLRVEGDVARPLELSLSELGELGVEEFDAVLVCIHNRLGWGRLGNQRWQGVPLPRVLAAAGAGPGAQWLVTRAVDGFEASVPLGLGADYPAYVVLGMGGGPLTAAHGAPARVMVPGLYGQYTGAKWLESVRVQSEPGTDYWPPRGWPRSSAFVLPLSRIDAPSARTGLPAGRTPVTGVAWAPPHGVASVHLAVDGREIEAELAGELSPSSWRRWRAVVDLPPGRHELSVRCTSRSGQPQSAVHSTPFPDRVQGHHRVAVTAR
jgi:DMSO/TMAO reductase YedYZ molybdopterin-dependent catalytic subunit